MVYGRLRKSKNTVDSGDLPLSDSTILGIPSQLPMHPRGMGTVDHLRILLVRTIGQTQQMPRLIEKCGSQFSMCLRLDQIANIRIGALPQCVLLMPYRRISEWSSMTLPCLLQVLRIVCTRRAFRQEEFVKVTGRAPGSTVGQYRMHGLRHRMIVFR